MRQLPPKLKAFFDTLEIPPNRDISDVAMRCLGITEEGKDNHGALVELFQSSVGTPEGQPWCMDFVQACLAYVEESHGYRSPVPSGQSVLDVWNRAGQGLKQGNPWAGDIILWQKKGSSEGHCGIIVGLEPGFYHTVEGNTGPSDGEIEREGDGVYLKKRKSGGTLTFNELGILKCFP